MKVTISGVRGIPGKDLDMANVLRLCSGFASIISSTGCVVGRDTRNSGFAISGAVSSTLTGCGLNVTDLGVAPTPVVFREARRHGAGVMVTASHNPISWNGLKFVIDGRSIGQTHLDMITTQRANIRGSYGTHTDDITRDAIQMYVQGAADIIGDVKGRPSVLVDSGGGAADLTATTLLESVGCRVGRHEPAVPRPDPTVGTLSDAATEAQNYDMAVVFDMDGDRVVLVKDGRARPPDATLGLGVAAAMERGVDTFAMSFDTSILVERYVTERGGRVYRSPVGEANVVDAMMRRGAPAGGEGSSAGFIMGGFNWCRDGILTAGLISSMIKDKVTNDILDCFENTCIIRTKVPQRSALPSDLSDALGHESSEIDTSDGVRAILDEFSWVLVRSSNTEDIIRISAEAPSVDRCRDIVGRVSDMVGNNG